MACEILAGRRLVSELLRVAARRNRRWPPSVLALSDSQYPPSVQEALAQYAGRAVNAEAARSGAAQVCVSLAAAR